MACLLEVVRRTSVMAHRNSPLRLRFTAGKYQADSTIPIRLPQDFTTAVSSHKENGLSLEAGVGLALPLLNAMAPATRAQPAAAPPLLVLALPQRQRR